MSVVFPAALKAITLSSAYTILAPLSAHLSNITEAVIYNANLYMRGLSGARLVTAVCPGFYVT